MAGRKAKYYTHVQPYLNDIKRWVGKDGATERQVAFKLGIAYPTFNKYKQEHQELVDVLKDAKCNLVEQLRGALIKKALGFEYKEVKTYSKMDEATGKETTYFEETTKQSLPDVAAINLALKNYSEDGEWYNDPATHKLRERELSLREKIAERGLF